MKKNLSDTFAEVAQAAEVTEKDTKAVLTTFFKMLPEWLVKKDDEVSIYNVGTFRVKTTKPRKSRNPKTGESLVAPAKTKRSVKFSRNFKEV